MRPGKRATPRPALEAHARWDKIQTRIPSKEELGYTVPLSASDAQMRDVHPGDFVEVRRTGRTFSGVVLPIPEEQSSGGVGHGASLAVVLITGVLELVRSTDVMLQFPRFVDEQVATAASPLRRGYVTAPTNRVSLSPAAAAAMDPVAQAELLNLRQSASSENAFMEQEPLDTARFKKRAWICRKIRYLQRETDEEIQRIFPAFRALFLQAEEDRGSAPQGTAKPAELQLLDAAWGLLHRGNFTTFEAARQVVDYMAHMANEPAPAEDHFRGETVFALHTLLMNHPRQFLVDSTTHRHSQMFTYRSAHEQAILARVTHWVRASATASGPGGREDAAVLHDTEGETAARHLDGFCHRARRVIQWHERHNHPAGPIRPLEPPRTDAGEKLVWTETDRAILAFLKISLGNRRELQDDPTGSVAMALVKRVGAHIHLQPNVHPSMESIPPHTKPLPTAPPPPLMATVSSVDVAGTDLQHALVFNFLTRLGALTPWEDPNTLDTYLNNGEENAKAYAEAHADTRKRLETQPAEEAQRHDFGDLPVYVIDAASANELDDGISVAPPDHQGDRWVHVHIADPTAWIPPHHPLAYEAQQKYSSIYFPQVHWPLFPTYATYAGMSLAGSPAGQRVLTFSAKVSERGEVRDWKIRPALVHNVQTLNYDAVNALFVQRATPSDQAFYPKRTRDDLVALGRLAGQLSARRIQVGGGVNAGNPTSAVAIQPLPLPSLATATMDHPRFFQGFPDLQVELTEPMGMVKPGTFDGLPGGISSESMVSEMMLLAGRVAASFGTADNVPLPFRLQDAPDTHQVEIIDKLKNPVTGVLPITELQQRDIFMSPGYFSAQAGIHYGLGIRSMQRNSPQSDALYRGGYVRVTSPLRRYSDLLSHWQLKSTLMHGKPLFNEKQVTAQFSRFERMEAWVKQIERASHRFWIWTYLDQLLKKMEHSGTNRNNLGDDFTPNEKTLLGPNQAFVGIPDVRLSYDTLQGKIRVNLLHLGGYPADCLWDPKVPPPKRGETLKVTIEQTISAGSKRTIICKAIE